MERVSKRDGADSSTKKFFKSDVFLPLLFSFSIIALVNINANVLVRISVAVISTKTKSDLGFILLTAPHHRMSLRELG